MCRVGGSDHQVQCERLGWVKTKWALRSLVDSHCVAQVGKSQFAMQSRRGDAIRFIDESRKHSQIPRTETQHVPGDRAVNCCFSLSLG